MYLIFVASTILAFSAARVTDVKKEFPAWPNVFSTTIFVTDPYESTYEGGHEKEMIFKIWYDGEAGNVKQEYLGRTQYTLKNYNGGAILNVRNGECVISYEVVESDFTNPLPPLQDKAEFLGEFEVEGQQVEQWQVGGPKFSQGSPTLNIYIRREDRVAIPVRFEAYPEIPPVGSDMILPIVAEFKEFTTAKPDASIFEIDSSKCKEAPKISTFMKKFL